MVKFNLQYIMNQLIKNANLPPKPTANPQSHSSNK